MRAFAVSAALLVLLLGCGPHAVRQQGATFDHPGEQWLSWSTTERNYFVIGFLQGYGDGSVEGCQTAKKNLAEIELSQSSAHHPYTFDERDCYARVPTYTKLKFEPPNEPDTSVYTKVITEFYTKYPQHRNIPYLYLMQLLKGEKVPTASDINSMAQSGSIRTHW